MHNYNLEDLSSFKNLPKDGKFFYKGKRVIIDLFTNAEFYYAVSGDKVEGKLRMGSTEIALSQCEAIFPGWFLYGGVLRMLPEEAHHPYVKSVDPIPFLVLKDRTGAFADLWMDYGEAGKAEFHDPTQKSWRKSALEKNWEKDLLETGFIKKIVGESHYYCPLEKVAKSLIFLLEIGWKIIDYQGRQVVRQGAKDLALKLEGERIVLSGTISYDAYEVDVEKVVGAFNRRQQFVLLNPSVVGLIEPQAGWEDLKEEEGALGIKKNQFALMEPFFAESEVEKEAAVIDLMKRLENTQGIQVAEPGEDFRGKLYPYQQEGLNWLYFLYTSGFHGLLADEMGLGKTVQILAFLSLLKSELPVLIVLPTSLLFNWKREFEKFLPSYDVYVHAGTQRIRDVETLKGKKVILTSYALLRLDAELFQGMEYACAVLDEAQLIKNPDSQIARCAYQLNARLRLTITGTPVENRWEDLWSLFHFAMPELLGDKGEFEPKIAKRKIAPFILRRKKEEVALDLPEKIEQVVWVEMTDAQREFYEEWQIKTQKGVLKKVQEEGAGACRMEILEAILRLRQICCDPRLVDPQAQAESGKLHQLYSDLEEGVAAGRKILVYSQFTSQLKLIEKGLIEKKWKYVYLDGSTRDREKVVGSFQEDPAISIFLISLKAGGVGLNLTAADYVFLYDPWWNEAVEAQAIDRAHRVGRKSTVIAKRYVTVSSIEEKMMLLKNYKSSLASDLFENQGENNMDLLYELLSSSSMSS